MNRRSLGDSSPFDRSIEERAERILGSLDLSSEEINFIVEEWCSYDFEIGQTTRMLTKLQRIAFEHLLKRSGQYEDYREQFRLKSPPEDDVIALPIEE